MRLEGHYNGQKTEAARGLVGGNAAIVPPGFSVDYSFCLSISSTCEKVFKIVENRESSCPTRPRDDPASRARRAWLASSFFPDLKMTTPEPPRLNFLC